jgi:hypothetical protein
MHDTVGYQLGAIVIPFDRAGDGVGRMGRQLLQPEQCH